MEAILSTLILGLAVSIVTQILKMVPAIGKLGDYGKQAVVLLIAIIIAFFQYGFGLLNPQVITIIAGVWGLAIGWNEVLLSKFQGSKE